MNEYRVRIRVTQTGPKGDPAQSSKSSGEQLDLEEIVEAPFLLKALGIVLRRAMQIPLALMAAAENDDPYRT